MQKTQASAWPCCRCFPCFSRSIWKFPSAVLVSRARERPLPLWEASLCQETGRSRHLWATSDGKRQRSLTQRQGWADALLLCPPGRVQSSRSSYWTQMRSARRWKELPTAACCRSLPLCMHPAPVLHLGHSAHGQQGLLTWLAAGNVGRASGANSKREEPREGGSRGKRPRVVSSHTESGWTLSGDIERGGSL